MNNIFRVSRSILDTFQMIFYNEKWAKKVIFFNEKWAKKASKVDSQLVQFTPKRWTLVKKKDPYTF